MPIARNDIERLLDELDREPADALEDQGLDFKEWDTSSDHQSVRLAVAAAVCMANGGGGTVVFGVRGQRRGPRPRRRGSSAPRFREPVEARRLRRHRSAPDPGLRGKSRFQRARGG